MPGPGELQLPVVSTVNETASANSLYSGGRVSLDQQEELLWQQKGDRDGWERAKLLAPRFGIAGYLGFGTAGLLATYFLPSISKLAVPIGAGFAKERITNAFQKFKGG